MMNNIVMTGVDWNGIINPIKELFFGTDTMTGIIENEMVVGMFIFLILFTLTLMMGLGMVVGSVTIVPALFAVFDWVPSLRILVAIISGLLLGFALNRIIKR